VHTLIQPGYLQQKPLIVLNIKNRIKMNPKNKDRVVFYLSSENKYLLNNQCELLQIKTSFFVRNCVLEKLGKPIFEIERKDINLQKYTSQLIHIGNNLNQISRKLNSNVEFNIADQIKVLEDIKMIKNHIIEIKSHL